MQVARSALQREHQFEIEGIEKEWMSKIENQRGEHSQKEHRLQQELKRAIQDRDRLMKEIERIQQELKQKEIKVKS